MVHVQMTVTSISEDTHPPLPYSLFSHLLSFTKLHKLLPKEKHMYL